MPKIKIKPKIIPTRRVMLKKGAGKVLIQSEAIDSSPTGTIAYLLGRRSFGKGVSTLVQVVERIQDGLPITSFNRLREDFNLKEDYLSQSLGISRRTIKRRSSLKSDESDKLYRLAHLSLRAAEVLGGREEAIKWLQSPRAALGGKTPMEIATTDVGTKEVEMLLGRIEHGVFT